MKTVEMNKALPKSGEWTIEGKYNGWRVWVHNLTGAMFNRKLEPLSISREFEPALEILRGLAWEPGSPFWEGIVAKRNDSIYPR